MPVNDVAVITRPYNLGGERRGYGLLTLGEVPDGVPDCGICDRGPAIIVAGGILACRTCVLKAITDAVNAGPR